MKEKNKYTRRVEESIKLRAEAEQAREGLEKVKKELRELCQNAETLRDEAQRIIREGKERTRKAIVG